VLPGAFVDPRMTRHWGRLWTVWDRLAGRCSLLNSLGERTYARMRRRGWPIGLRQAAQRLAGSFDGDTLRLPAGVGGPGSWKGLPRCRLRHQDRESLLPPSRVAATFLRPSRALLAVSRCSLMCSSSSGRRGW
jgi:hypothetical protein